MMMSPLRYTLLVLAVVVAFSNTGHSDVMRAATTVGPGLEIVLTWPADAPTARFNLYRKTSDTAMFPTNPLNGVPIARLTDCSAIQGVTPSGDKDWQLISDGLAADPKTPFYPCDIGTLTAGSIAEQKLQLLASSHWRIAIAAGQGYRDVAVAAGTTYDYELRAVDALGVETGVLFTGITVTAGSPKAIPPPPNLSATSGDYRVLLLWGDQPEAAGFAVLRATAAAGPYIRVNESALPGKITQDLEGNPLPGTSGTSGMLDIQRWTQDGSPDTHTVQGVSVAGPLNGVTYFYKLQSLDLLENAGPPTTTPVKAQPIDKTPPSVPTGVTVTAFDAVNRIEIRWTLVEKDVDGHAEQAVQGYQVYRYESEDAPPDTGMPLGGLVPTPTASGQLFQTTSDTSADLRPPYGEKLFWYRVAAVDGAGNVGAYSAAIGGHLSDITAPAPPKGTAAEGFDDFIRVTWKASSEPDLDGYIIYRSLCHNGVANPCQPGPEDVGVFGTTTDWGKTFKTPCTGEYVIVGTLSAADAAAMGGSPIFEDHTVPKGSPVCYSYWIKAYDKAQNKSGKWPFPDPNTETTVCQRLRDKTPPEPAIIAGIHARDRAIRVEWIGPPVQDIRAYHVYRSDNEKGTYKWVGGMTVELPPKIPQTLAAPYKAPQKVGCDAIPLLTIDDMSMGFFLDTSIHPKTIYWYKVVGIDQSGNEAPVDLAVPVSTFTFSRALPSAPVITSITATSAEPFALVIRWTPDFDPNAQRGFALFRSDKVDGLYRQIGTLLNGSQYPDINVVRGVTYWYKVVRVEITGQTSPPSMPSSGSLGPQ